MTSHEQPLLPEASASGLASFSSAGDASPDSLKKHVTAEERAIVTRVLEAVEARGQELEKRGLTKKNFIFGVANSLFVVFMFGAYPEHFWLVYLLEVLVLFPLRWHKQVTALPLKQHFYWFDFCWFSNFLSAGCLITLVANYVVNPNERLAVFSEELRRKGFSACWGLGCGPLLIATGLGGNALIFHDADATACVLIHLFPSLVLYCMGWEWDRVEAAWPSVFSLDYVKDLRPGEIFRHAAMVYTFWLVLYTVWLLLHGMGLPAKGYDTIFHANMRGGFGGLIASVLKTPKESLKSMADTNQFPVSYALLYMLGHALGVYLAIGFSLVLFLHQYVHRIATLVMVGLTIYRGSSRYTFYIIHSYGILLRKELGIPLHRKGSALV